MKGLTRIIRMSAFECNAEALRANSAKVRRVTPIV